MKNIKQIIYAGTASIFAFAPLMAGAALGTPTNPGNTSVSTGASTEGTRAGLTNTTVFALVSNIMNWLLGLVGILGVIGFVVAGILYLTAAGDEDQIEKAKSLIMYAIIGLVVAFVGLIIVNAVGGIFGGGGVTTNF